MFTCLVSYPSSFSVIHVLSISKPVRQIYPHHTVVLCLCSSRPVDRTLPTRLPLWVLVLLCFESCSEQVVLTRFRWIIMKSFSGLVLVVVKHNIRWVSYEKFWGTSHGPDSLPSTVLLTTFWGGHLRPSQYWSSLYSTHFPPSYFLTFSCQD